MGTADPYNSVGVQQKATKLASLPMIFQNGNQGTEAQETHKDDEGNSAMPEYENPASDRFVQALLVLARLRKRSSLQHRRHATENEQPLSKCNCHFNFTLWGLVKVGCRFNCCITRAKEGPKDEKIAEDQLMSKIMPPFVFA